MVNVIATQFLQALPADLTQPHINITTTLMDVLFEHNVRLVDISEVWSKIISHITTIKTELDMTIANKNDEKLVEVFGKDKLDDFSKVFGATQDVPENSVRNIRINDIF